MATRLFNRLSDFHLSSPLRLKAMFDKILGQVETQNDQQILNIAGIAANLASITTLQSQVDNIGTDGVLSKLEKLIVIQGVNDIINEKSGIDTQATALSITTEKTAYDTAYTNLINYLNALSPAYTDVTQDTTIVRATWDSKFNLYYDARQDLFNKFDNNASAQSVVIDPIPSVTIYADSSGVARGLPKDVQLTASKGNSVVTASGTWSRTVTPGVTCTIGSATGLVDITALTATSVSVPISFTYSGVTRTGSLNILRVDDQVTVANTGGGGGTSGTTSSTTVLADATGTTYGPVSATLTATAGSAGQVQCVAPINYEIVVDTEQLEQTAKGKWQWRVPSGTWADITTEVTATDTASNENIPPVTKFQGTLSVTQTKGLLTAGSDYEFQFLWRNSTSALDLTRVSGTMTATGS